MNRYIVLLRGVMPTGKNRVPMAQLRAVMGQAGYGNVRTWIQSGNLLVDTEQPPGETAARVRTMIRERIGPDLTVIARTAAEVQSVLAGNPFQSSAHDPKRVFYAFFETPPGPETVDSLTARNWGDNALVVTPDAAYMYIPGDYTKAKLNAAALEKLSGVACTMRNANTLTKLVGMANIEA